MPDQAVFMLFRRGFTGARGVLLSVDDLEVNPQRVGKPLFGPLAGCHGAWRGTYRVAYRIDENSRVVHALGIHHRSEIYHRPQQ